MDCFCIVGNWHFPCEANSATTTARTCGRARGAPPDRPRDGDWTVDRHEVRKSPPYSKANPAPGAHPCAGLRSAAPSCLRHATWYLDVPFAYWYFVIFFHGRQTIHPSIQASKQPTIWRLDKLRLIAVLCFPPPSRSRAVYVLIRLEILVFRCC